MSDIENQQQWADQVQTERELEAVFKDIEDGIFLTDRQIDLLRYSCGLPPKQHRTQHSNHYLSNLVKPLEQTNESTNSDCNA
jgi:hypothetical protein